MPEHATLQQWAEKVPDWARPLPHPKSSPAHIEPSDVADLIRTKIPGVDFIVVDTRRQDWEASFVRTAINLPAQSFHQTLPTVLPLLKNVPLVIFYCNACTLVSRGSRTASWYQDAVDAAGITTSEARILTGGVRGWVASYGEDDGLTVKILS
ncbi:arsenate reductase [Trametopsis cervina]|nr:arsenate reductase [Trametopsis cervina]